MALILKDRVKETSSTTGTGTLDLDGAVAGFEGFVSSVGNGNICYYAIQDGDGIAWEVGVGTITDAAPDTLARNTILASSNADSVVTLSAGTHTVFLTYPAEKSVYRNLNDQVVLTASGVIFSDATVQTTAPVDTTYTASTGISLNGNAFSLDPNDDLTLKYIQLTSSNILIGSDTESSNDRGNIATVMLGRFAGNLGKDNIQVSMLGPTAGYNSSGNANSIFLGFQAGIEASGGYQNTYIGQRAGRNTTGSHNLEIINSGLPEMSILGNESHKIHIQNVIAGSWESRRLAIGDVGASHLNPNASLEVVSQNVGDTGLYVHNVVVAQTGIILPANTPVVTTNKLYNVGGTLYFNGNAVDTDTNTTYSAGDGLSLATTTFSVDGTVSRSGGNISQFINNSGYLNTHPSITAASSSNNSGRTYIQDVLVDSNGHVTGLATATETVTDTNTTYTAGSGLQLASTTFNVEDDYLRNDASDTTTGTITAGGFSTTGVITVGQAFKSNNKSNSDGGTVTFDLDVSNFHTVTIAGNRTLALSNADPGQKFAIRLQQDATGGRTVTWFSTIKWPDGVAPTLSSTGNKADLFGFVCTSAGQYDGFGIGYNL